SAAFSLLRHAGHLKRIIGHTFGETASRQRRVSLRKPAAWPKGFAAESIRKSWSCQNAFCVRRPMEYFHLLASALSSTRATCTGFHGRPRRVVCFSLFSRSAISCSVCPSVRQALIVGARS